MFTQVSKKALLAAACAASVGLGAQAAAVWTGGGADGSLLFAADNYDFTSSTISSIDPVVVVTDDVNYVGANITASDNTAFNQYLIGDGFTVTIDGTSFTTTGSGGFNGVDTAADGGATNTGPASFIDIVNGSAVSLQYVSEGLTVNVDGTSSLTIRGGGDGINSQIETTSVTLAQGGQLILPTFAEFAEQGGEIFAANASGTIVSYNDDNSILSFNGTTATAVNAVPEPGSLALLGLGGLAMLRRRRG